MKLLQMKVYALEPALMSGAEALASELVQLDFREPAGGTRPLTLVYGGPGSGKTSLLSGIRYTRPGHCVAYGGRSGGPRIYAQTQWSLGIDEPDREAPLVLSTPGAPLKVSGPVSAEARREAMLFDGLARQGGFAFVYFSALRWFSSPALSLTAPERTIARYEVRPQESLTDASRQDLARETKQCLTYGGIVGALSSPGVLVAAESQREGTPQPSAFARNLLRVLDALGDVVGVHYLGIDSLTLEAQFSVASGRSLNFDQLPSEAKHALAIGVLSLRALWAAYPGLDPLRAPGIVAIDQVELQLDVAVAQRLVEVLVQLFPEVQWILTTRQAELLAAFPPDCGVALRQERAAGLRVDVGINARVH